MDRTQYGAAFARWARWYIPKQEVEDVLSDYEDILEHHALSQGAEVAWHLDSPRNAARILRDSREYGRWLGTLILLMVCLLPPVLLLWRGRFDRDISGLWFCLQVLGTAVALAGLRWERHREKRPLPKGLLPALGGLAVVTAVTALILIGLAMGWWGMLPPYLYGQVARGTLLGMGTVAAAAGIWGLIQSRMWDTRWRALYILALAGGILCMLVFSILVRMDLDLSQSGWLQPYLIQWCGCAGIGAAGTGAALC